ncbi:MAG: hypothetical protein NNA23_04150 [Nitrospira sp.]|nr:hypothetical protein [Nitrospira sp.]MCP9464394.1 hypothetical protein [Nitrospira sp.]
MERLVERWGDTRPEKPGARGKAVLAIVVVNRQGQRVESPLGVFEFRWGNNFRIEWRIERSCTMARY